MYVLGLCDNHLSGAALLKDGKIIAASSEERFTNQKCFTGFPEKSIRYALSVACIKPSEVDKICFAHLTIPISQKRVGYAWHHKILSGISNLPGNQILGSSAFVKPYVLIFKHLRGKREVEKKLKLMGFNCKIQWVEHHLAHAGVSFFTKSKKSLVFTNDGSGDALCGTVSIKNGNQLDRLCELSSYHSIGEFYSQLTEFLGMERLEHEYKVMGLAPYASQQEVDKLWTKFKKLYCLSKNGLAITNTSGRWGSAQKKIFAGLNARFDVLSAAVQRLVEELITNWVYNWVSNTGIKNIECAGGVFMNVKTNMLLAYSNKINNVFVFPSCGDESLPIGACGIGYAEELQKGVPGKFFPINDLYLGPDVLVDKSKLGRFQVSDVDPDIISKMLANGEIVARCSGRMEWGARALGNRSILADPSNLKITRELNFAVKQRDFWMPFAPVMLKEREKDYIVNPKGIPAPFMIFAFNTTENRKDIIAGTHIYDFTARPQVIERGVNTDYYDIVKSFENRTGIGALINTSFNLHGLPICRGQDEAVWTLKNSGLKHLILGDKLISKA